MQTVTKEADWRIAKAYVALASLPDHELKSKEGLQGERPERGPGEGVASGSLQAQAVDHYLDDDEWEQRERREGRGVAIPKFPVFDTTQPRQMEKRGRS